MTLGASFVVAMSIPSMSNMLEVEVLGLARDGRKREFGV